MKKNNSLVSNWGVIAVIAICFLISHIQNDIIIPSFPDIRAYFSTDPTTFHYATSSNFAAIGIASVILGPLSDMWGRRTVLIAGLLLFTIGTVGCIFFSNIWVFIAWRFVQGFGTAAPMVICITIIFDLFTKKKSAQIVGFMDGVLTSGKSLAPIMGGWINVNYGWKTNFIVVFALALFSLYVVQYSIKNKAKEDIKGQFKFINAMSNYYKLITNGRFLAHAVVLGMMACSMIVYINSIPLIFIEHLGVEKQAFSFYLASIMGTFALSSFLSSIIIELVGEEKTKNIGLVLIVFGSIFLLSSAYKFNDPLSITLSMVMCTAGFAMAIVIYFTRAMSFFPSMKGASSALLASIRLAIISVSMAIAGKFFNGTIIPVAWIVVSMMSFSGMIYLLSLFSTVKETKSA